MNEREVTQLEELERDLRRLERRFPSVREDIKAATRLIAAGQLLWQQARYPGFGQREIWKGRVINRDINKGKSSGYRLIWETSESYVTLVYVYDKNISEQAVKNEIARRLRG